MLLHLQPLPTTPPMRASGFELGYSDNGKYYVYNHLTFNILVSLTHGEYTAALEQSRGSIINDIDVRKAARRQLSAGAGGAEEQQDGQAQRRWVAGGSATDLSGLRSSLRRLSRSLMADDKAKATPASGSTPGAEQDEDEEEDEEEEPYYMVVGFEVAPCSIAREAGKPIENVVCDDTKVQPQELKEGAKIVYSYDVFWQESSIKWASRWDAYLRMPGGEVRAQGLLSAYLRPLSTHRPFRVPLLYIALAFSLLYGTIPARYRPSPHP